MPYFPQLCVSLSGVKTVCAVMACRPLTNLVITFSDKKRCNGDAKCRDICTDATDDEIDMFVSAFFG